MRRRDFVRLGGAALTTRWLAGCDRLVILDDRVQTLLDPITSNEDFYTYSYSGPPRIDADAQETKIVYDGQVLATYDRAFLQTLTPREKEHTLECIGTKPTIQNIGNAIWGGLPLAEVLAALGVTIPASAVGLRLVGLDAYHAGVPIEDLEGLPIWLMWEMNGEPLPDDHGAPARLIVPGRYGVKNLKWLDEIAFVDTPHESFWTSRGWSEEAEYLANTLISTPVEGIQIDADTRTLFAGTAYAGRDPVERVEVSIDDGPWEDVTLDYNTGEPDIWVLWSWLWTPTKGDRGMHTIQVRCTTASGVTSRPEPNGTNQFHGYDGSMAIAVQVKG